MNRENLDFNNNSNTETLEKQEKDPVGFENIESGQKFVERILNDIKNYMNSFLSKKEAVEEIESNIYFDDETIKEKIKSEINLDSQLDEIDVEAKIIQTEASQNINSIIRDFSKAYHHPKYRTKVAKQIIEAKGSGQDAESIRSGFYDKTSSEKENFESQEKERSVAEIMKEKDLVIIHAIPLKSEERRSTPANNPVLKSNGYQDFKTSVEIISGLSPTISTSIPLVTNRDNGLYYPSGVILGEGRVLSSSHGDNATVAHGLYKRISKYGEGEKAIDSDININKMVEFSAGGNYNELTVEKPEIAGLFYDLTEKPELPIENPKKEEVFNIELYNRQKKEQRIKLGLYEMKKYSEEFNVPLYIFKKENEILKKYRITFLPKEEEKYFTEVIKPKADKLLAESQKNKENVGKYESYIYGDEYMEAEKKSKMIEKSDYILEEVTAKDIYESKIDIPDEERKKMIEDIKNKGILSESAEKEVDKKFQNLN